MYVYIYISYPYCLNGIQDVCEKLAIWNEAAG